MKRAVFVVFAVLSMAGLALADIIVDVPRAKVPPTAEIVEGDRARELPPSLKIEGTPVARASFVDKDGEHVVVITVTDVKTTPAKTGDEDPTSEKHIFGWHFVKPTKRKAKDVPTTWKELWRTKDWVKDCPFDLFVDYVPGSLEVTDLDADGVFETLFAYRMTCASDVSPFTLKLLMHEGTTKYAVRGTTRVQVGAHGEEQAPVFAGGELNPDDAFKRAPKGFLDHATMRFRLFADAAPW
jgi:hypothetical protein